MRWRRFLGIVSIIIVGCGFIVWFIFNQFIVPATLSPSESALKQTQQLLTEIQSRPGGSMPNELPGYLRVDEDCWNFLQSGMLSNTNQYKLTITRAYDSRYDPNSVHDLIEVYLDIDFPDGRKAEMYYSQGGLTGCRER